MAIARRIGSGMKIVIGDKNIGNAHAIARTMNQAGFDTIPLEMDLSSRDSILHLIAEAQRYGNISMLVNAAGVSPSQASVETILKVDLYGTAVLLEEVGKVICPGGSGVTISSQSGQPHARSDCRTGRTTGHDSNRGIAEPRTPPTREYQGHSACLPDGETLQRQACHGGSRQMGCQRASRINSISPGHY